jgi:hypothetical protein
MEFHTVKNTDGRLVLTLKRWVERINAIGIFFNNNLHKVKGLCNSKK